MEPIRPDKQQHGLTARPLMGRNYSQADRTEQLIRGGPMETDSAVLTSHILPALQCKDCKMDSKTALILNVLEMKKSQC